MKSLLSMAMLKAAHANFDPISAQENGQSKTLYLANKGDGLSSAIGSTASVDFNARAFLASTNAPSITPAVYYQPNLLGGSVSFDTNL